MHMIWMLIQQLVKVDAVGPPVIEVTMLPLIDCVICMESSDGQSGVRSMDQGIMHGGKYEDHPTGDTQRKGCRGDASPGIVRLT